jgi:formamidopyrimidine-DNA glycosylase
MPELPEVETVRNTLKPLLVGHTIKSVNVIYDNIIEYPGVKEFKETLINKTIKDIKRRGKWLIFVLGEYSLLSHLRMEGRYYIKDVNDPLTKHTHVVFNFKDFSLRYIDTRKFGKMHLLKTNDLYLTKPLNSLGKEPWDVTLDYLKDKLKNKKIAIKTILLDQSIIAGIGNIYVDEILFLSKIHPETKPDKLDDNDLKNIIKYTKDVMDKAIREGGTTIKSYEASEGVHGLFQNLLLVHTKDMCPICKNKITKIKVGGRGTYLCNKCQKKK